MQALNIATQLRVITPSEREELARQPLRTALIAHPPRRGERRIPASV